MKKTALVFVVGVLATAGVALADSTQNADITSTLNNPVTGPQDVELNPTGLPMTDVAYGEHVDGANAALAGAGVPAEVQHQDNGLRANAKCSADLPPEACITDEPVVAYPANQVMTMNQDSAGLSKFILLDSRDESTEAFTFVPDEAMDPQTRAALEDTNEQVNAAIEVSLDDGTSAPGGGLRVRGSNHDGGASLNLRDLTVAGGFAANLLGEGRDAPWGGQGLDEFFEGAPVALADFEEDSGANLGVEGSGQDGSGSADIGAMALGAALVGGAILGPMALYHRIRSNHALNNKTRQMVYNAVVEGPGIGVNDAAKAAGCSYSTAAYHLERLVEERLLVASEDGRRARYFKNGGAFSQAEREFVPILQSKEAMAVLQVIVENPWCYRAEVAQKLGVSGPTVNWHLRKLMAAGVVKEMREGRVSYLYADKKSLTGIGANLVGKLHEDLVGRLRFERRPTTEMVEPALGLPETTVPDVGADEVVELAPLPESR